MQGCLSSHYIFFRKKHKTSNRFYENTYILEWNMGKKLIDENTSYIWIAQCDDYKKISETSIWNELDRQWKLVFTSHKDYHLQENARRTQFLNISNVKISYIF